MPISQAIRQAGTGGITKQEINQITKSTGKSSGDVVQRLDQINQNIRKNDGIGINLNSGAANMLIRGASKAAPTFSSMFGSPSVFGTGKIGQTLQSMSGRRTFDDYLGAISGKQTRTAAGGPTFLARGMDLMPSGRQTVRGIGPQYTGPEKVTIKNLIGGVGDPLGSDRGTSTTQVPTTIPKEEPMTPEDMAAASTDGRFDSAAFGNWATGYKSARSGRNRAGRSAQGLGSMRNAPKTNTLGY